MKQSILHMRKQRGFALSGLMVVLVLGTVGAIFAASEARRVADDNAAESTGRYLLQLRAAVIDLQVRHEAWLTNRDIGSAAPGTYPAPPALTWVDVDGAQVARGSVQDLIDTGVLAPTTARHPLLGDAARFALVREGTCPGDDCRISAFVYTCHPISGERSSRSEQTCTAPAGNRAEFSQTLLGKVLFSVDGYGGHDAMGGERTSGPLVRAPRAWFDFGDEPGHAIVVASLGATPFGQFVRHGETRPVVLRNSLSVEGAVQTDTGLVLNTAVAPGAPCTTAGMYATTESQRLAVCRAGVWEMEQTHIVTGAYSNLPHNAALPPNVCPSGMTGWRHASLQAIDVTVTGSNVNVGGSIGGSVSGTGWVNAAGSVSVNGSFSGTFQNSGSSYVTTAQRVTISADRINITPAGAGALATVLQGCRQ